MRRMPGALVAVALLMGVAGCVTNSELPPPSSTEQVLDWYSLRMFKTIPEGSAVAVTKNFAIARIEGDGFYLAKRVTHGGWRLSHFLGGTEETATNYWRYHLADHLTEVEMAEFAVAVDENSEFAMSERPPDGSPQIAFDLYEMDIGAEVPVAGPYSILKQENGYYFQEKGSSDIGPLAGFDARDAAFVAIQFKGTYESAREEIRAERTRVFFQSLAAGVVAYGSTHQPSHGYSRPPVVLGSDVVGLTSEQTERLQNRLQGSDVYVRGHYRSDGTYVQPHYRSAPDENPYNNYSYPGNVNPHAGR